MLWRTLTVLSVLAWSSCVAEEWREVLTVQGPVRGYSDSEGELYTFYNIPYATVPSGQDRYKAPLPAPVWQEPLEAIDRGIICLQEHSPILDLFNKQMQEDCLVVNVYVPNTIDTDLPVMVQIHGGAFEMGYGDMLPSESFVRENKHIFVTFNYRLGVHGFLCLGTDAAPGNAGLKDQLALLRWVQQNIASFGGNPQDVTLSGFSAGSISAHLLMLSKASEGLFNKVVLESGANVASISVQIDPLENARIYARILNFTGVDDFDILEDFYLNTPLESLVQFTFFERRDAIILFSPCIERSLGNEVILHDSPVNIIRNNDYVKVPILIGVTNMEGLLQIENFATWKDAMNEEFSNFLPADLQFESEEEKQEISQKIKEFYFGDQPVGEETILAYVDYFSDILFAYPTLRAVRLHVEAGHDKVFLYEYSFADDSTPVVPFTDVRGATHTAQTLAIYVGAFDFASSSEEFVHLITAMREMWRNFVLYGTPVTEISSLPAWAPSDANGGPYMSLGQTAEQNSILLEERNNFWEDIYQRYYRAPVAPTAQSSASITRAPLVMCLIIIMMQFLFK